jgi:hypothetical protein
MAALDAARFMEENMVGMRACIHDENDNFIIAMTDTKDVEFELRYAMGCYFGYPKVYV